MKKIIKINGMSCHHCEMRIKNSLDEIGVNITKISAKEGFAEIDVNENFDSKKIIETVDDAGYEVTNIE